MTVKSMLRVTSAGAALLLAAGGPAWAQDGGPQTDDTIIVTGSVIAGTPENASLPVDVINSEELSRLGDPTPVELIKALSVSSGVIGDTNQFDSRSQATEGMASVNLRGLSPQRTLVLLNNRRVTPAGTGVPIVDLNMFPSSAIGRIEILKDGAAATYGSDAIGGVVNFITRSDQDGLRINGDYTFVDGSDGDYSLGASFGYQGDNWNFLLAAGSNHRSELLALERDWAIQDYETNPEGGWSGGGNPATFVPLGVIPGVGVAPIAGLTPDPDCGVLGGYVDARNFCRTQYTPYDAIVEEDDRYQLYGEIDIDFNEALGFYAQGLYGNSEIPHYRSSPSYLLTQSPSASVGGSPSGFIVPGNNPGFIQMVTENPGYVPAGTVAVLFPTLLYRPFMVGGNPLFEGNPDSIGSQPGRRESELTWFSLGFDGTFESGVEWNLNYTHSEYDRYFDGYDSFGDRVQLALLGYGGPNCTPFAGAPGTGDCMWLNPFGNAIPGDEVIGVERPGSEPNQNTNLDLINWFFVPTSTQVNTDESVLEFTLSGGTGFELPGGEVLFGVGAQYRENTFTARYSDNNNLAVNPCKDTPVNGNTSCTSQTGALAFLGTNRDADASSDVYALYGELQVPVTDNFNVQLAARFEDYGGATGATFDPKMTLRWQVTDEFALRGSMGTTFRGPPAQQLAARNVTSLQVIANSFRPVDVFGNPNLQPESSTNFSAGAIWEPGNFSFSLDYFRYDIRDAITVEPLSGMVDTMFADPANCTDPAFDGLRQRFQFNDGGGVPGAGTCTATNIARVETNWVNGGGVDLRGLDFIGTWQHTTDNGTDVGIGATLSYVLQSEVGDEIVEGVLVQPGFDGAGQLNFQTTAYPVPEWKGRVFVEIGRDWWDARLTANYIDSYVDQRSLNNSGPFRPREDIVGNPTLMQGATVDQQVTFDLNVRLMLPWDTTVSGTVLNLTDEDPSFARLDYNYDPFTGNPLGRVFRLGISKEF